MAFEKELEHLEKRKQRALAMGGPEKVAQHHAKGKYDARQRIDHLTDKDSFMELGLLNHSDVPGMEDKTPADSKVGGLAKIDGRAVAILANDFTTLAATSSRVAGHKEGHIKHIAAKRGLPLVYLGEAGGARMPDIMGSKGLASFGGGGLDSYLHIMTRVRQTPMIAAVMGECYGMPTWMSCLADIVVQVKGSALGVSGPRVLEIALGEKITDEELGGWKVHAEVTGMSDAVVENEDECFEVIKRYLSYLPSHRDELPPFVEPPEGSGDGMPGILDILPDKRNRAYDMHKILACIADAGSLMPLKPSFGKNVITALARIGGRSVGFVANQPMCGAGAMDTDGIDKVISFLCLCDTFNVPLVFLHDTPGFMVGREAERRRVGAKVMNFMNALGLLSVPRISIIARKSYGMAFYNMLGSGSGADFLVAWPTAEISFVAPEIAANVVFGGKVPKDDREKEQWQQMVDKMIEDSTPYAAAGVHMIHDVIDPRDTRDYIIRCLDVCQDDRTGGISTNGLANWPTKF